jgi:hypothetical protein
MIKRPPVETTTPVWSGPKPTLPMTMTPTYRIHYEDLEAFLLEVFRFEFDVMNTLGITHGMFPEFAVFNRMPPAWNARQQADNVRRGRRCQNLPLILAVLCVDGFIPAGHYVLDTTERQSTMDRYRAILQVTDGPMHRDCRAFRAKHAKDKQFRQYADGLDKAVRTYMKETR